MKRSAILQTRARDAPLARTHTPRLWPVVIVCSAIAGLASAQTSNQAARPQDNPTLVATPADIKAGKLVQSPQGQGIGTVSDIVPDPATGRPAYVLVETDSGTTAIPFWAISHCIRDAHVVIDRPFLASAPRVNIAQLRSGVDHPWKEQAENYWRAYR